MLFILLDLFYYLKLLLKGFFIINSISFKKLLANNIALIQVLLNNKLKVQEYNTERGPTLVRVPYKRPKTH